MKLFKIIFGAALLIGTLGAQTATDRVTAHFSAPVQVNGTVMPAGDVSIQVMRSSGDNVFLVVRSEHGETANVLVNRVDKLGEEGAVTILLSRSAGVLHFRGVSLADASGFEVFPVAE
jgi:hypothetical protein